MSTSSQTQPILRLGVDVGGTNTDAVLLALPPSTSTSNSSATATPSNPAILATHKTPTTHPSITPGITTAIAHVLSSAHVPAASEQISHLSIGTTHFLNALIEHDTRRLSPVGIIRLSRSFTREVPPFSDFSPQLKAILCGYYGFVDGGLHVDGSQEAPVVEEQVVRECAVLREKGISAVVVAGVYSPIDEVFKQEYQVRDIILRQMPSGTDVVCSCEVANLGFLERENAAILNAGMMKFARRTIRALKSVMKGLGLRCGLFLTQNDGTLVEAGEAARLPIRTFSSGATNSMRGAAFLGGLLSGPKDGDSTSTIVVDIGGTTTDCGVLLSSGFPRQASAYSTVAGVRINYSMPHLESIGLGGGSIVRVKEDNVTVGPDSVGHFISEKARAFGGDALTATDISIAAGAKIEGASSELDLDSATVSKAQDTIKSLLTGVIDIMKNSPDPLPLMLVGGGSIIAPEDIPGVSEVTRPPYFEVANAVGAAIANVGATVDHVQQTAHQSVLEATDRVKSLAIERAVMAGAQRNTVKIVEVDAIPLQYMANQVRIIVRAVGELSTNQVVTEMDKEEPDDSFEEEIQKLEPSSGPVQTPVDIDSYRPKVIHNRQTGIPEWIISERDVTWLADGCYVLGCAGGGSPFAEFIQLRDQIREGYVMRVVDSSALADDAIIYWGGHMGSPAVSVERVGASESIDAAHELMDYLRHDSFDAVMGLEIGGGNGLQPLLWGSSKNFDRPVVDADWMGRAYPTYWQTTLCVHETGQLVPCAIASGDGKNLIMSKAPDDEIVDRALRAACSEMGSRVGMAARPTTTDRVRKYAVMNTMSLAWRIGRCIARSRTQNTISHVAEQIIEEIGGPSTAKILFRGKITAVERRLLKGHSYGEITIVPIAAEEEEGKADLMSSMVAGGALKIPFKNENIYAKHVADDGTETYIASVPDLISVLDVQSGKALGVPEFRYGLKVIVLGITCSPRWSDTARGLEIGGPAAFGYDEIVYKPLGVFVEPKSVVLEYAEHI
ncbi:MAG: hypothetical protein M1819_004549 [Sarea resinae]|nr:MAG: hypothetical protein M1819_004549 [Sarea resinae]